jgi:hypothetical protein
LPGHAVVEPHPDREQEVGRLDRPVDVLPAVHPHEAVAQRVGLVDDADAEQRVGDRDLGLLGEGDEVVPGLGVEDAMAGEDHRPLRVRDLGGGELQLAAVGLDVGAEARQARDDLFLGRMGRGRLLLEGVLRDVDVDRAGPAGPGDVEGLGDDPRQLVGVADQVVVLRHRQRDAVDVDLLERVLADERAGDVAGDRDDRDGVEERGADPGDEVRGARAGRAHADPDAAGDAGVAVGGVGAALLVADEDVAELRVVAEDVVQRQDHATGIAEEDVHALVKERLADDVGTDPRPPPRPRVVEHRLAGALDRPRRSTSRRRGHGSGARRGSAPPDSAASPTLPSSSSWLSPDPFQANKKPPPPGEGPFGLRWWRLSVRPSEVLRSPAGSR